jgi:uncharacterized membrane protein
MKNRWMNAVLVCLLSSLASQAHAATATFQIVKDPVAQTWVNFALSKDGSVMAANYGGEIYRWTAKDGFKDLGPGDPYSSSIGISADGTTIISGSIGADGYSSPAIWKAGHVIDLGHPPNGCPQIGNSWGSGYSLNADGSVAVGLAWNCSDAEGFAWTAKYGSWSLGHPPGHSSSRATAISANGASIVGFWEDPTGPRRPVRWVGGKHDLFLGAATLGEASAVSGNGKFIVGQIYNSVGGAVTFLYTDKHGLRKLGTISHLRTDQSFPNGISNNGRIVGWSGDPFGAGIEAFFWNPKRGMKRLSDVLKSMGAKIPSDFILTTAVAISIDGSTMAGQYVDGQFNIGNWIARISE